MRTNEGARVCKSPAVIARLCLLSVGALLATSSFAQTDVRVQEIKNPGLGAGTVGALDVVTHFSAVIIMGVAFPLWIIATLAFIAELRSWGMSSSGVDKR